MGERPHEREVEHHVHDEAEDRDPYRRPRVLPREVAGRQHLDQHEGRQPGGIGDERARRGAALVHAERAALEQHRDHGARDDDEGHRRRHRQQQCHLDRPVEASCRLLGLACPQLPAQQRQQRGPHRHADDSEGKLVHAVGVVEKGNRSGRQQRCDDDVDHQVDLGDAGAERRRRGEDEQALHPRREPRPTQPKRHPRPRGRHDQPDELADPAHSDADRERVPRRLGPARKHEQGPDQAEVEQDRRGRDRSEAVERVQHPAQQCDERYQQDVGEGEARELHGQLQLARLVGEARRERVHEPRHHDLGHDDQHQQRPQQDGENVLRERFGRLPPVALQRACEERHEGRVERALREQPPQEVRQLEGDEEGVRYRACAQDRGDQDVAQEAQDARAHGVAADGCGPAGERHRLRGFWTDGRRLSRPHCEVARRRPRARASRSSGAAPARSGHRGQASGRSGRARRTHRRRGSRPSRCGPSRWRRRRR